MTEVALALNTTAGLINFFHGQLKSLTDGAFRVSGFSNAGFHDDATLSQLTRPVPIPNGQLPMVRGNQSKQHVYWLRYLRRGIGITDKKRVCVDLLVRFTTFDYVPKDGQQLTQQETQALRETPLWGIANLGITLMPSGRGRNPFNKFNELGSLEFDVTAASEGMPYFRINYRVQHQAKSVMGATLALNHNDSGSFLVHSNGAFEISPGEGRTPKHFRITPLSGSTHDRPSAIGQVVQQTVKIPFKATGVELGGADRGVRMPADVPVYKNIKIHEFANLDGPNSIVADDGQQRVTAHAVDEQESAFRLEYRRNGGVVGRTVHTKIRVLLLLRFTTVSYLTPPNNGQQQIIHQHGSRYIGFRNVSLEVLDVGRGNPDVVGEHGEKYDVSAVKNRFGEESELFFGPSVRTRQGEPGAQVWIDWWASHAGAKGKSKAHHNSGNLRLTVNPSGSPVLLLEGKESSDYFVVTG
ncbi:hypothetical protein [Micromonospora cathayae]|uniref:Uncharacterized protein n=1 Tax=Micromonospora cathayae TaxID=3028804 RepID=A0ABY7ZVX3_9ACTN|nr:hypothetical protein [Micromonospora sp. HUAS 3]WDZ87028.1 hypothetical protein PVK37_11805 [Micromonospora sp. HUAS 3]